jgi:hypothetical protein
LRRSKVLAAREVVPPPKRGDVPLVHGDGRLKATCLIVWTEIGLRSL